MRRAHSCGWMDCAAGFPVLITERVCRICLVKGVHTPEAQEYRKRIIQVSIEGVLRDGTGIPLVRQVLEHQGYTVPARRTPTVTRPIHWPLSHWRGYWNAWDGVPFPVALWRGVTGPFKRAWADLRASVRGGRGPCGGCGCWKPGKDSFLWCVRTMGYGKRPD